MNKMRHKTVFILLLLTVLHFTEATVATDNSAESILAYVEEHSANFHLGSKNDVVLVFGAAGSNKNILTSLITNTHLESIESDGEFRVIKVYYKNAEFDKTIPNLLTDEQNDVDFYDCPAISNPKDVDEELTATSTLQKLLNFAQSIKFLFIVSHAQLTGDDGSVFLELVRYATGLIKDVEKYRDGIALAVTYVPNSEDDASNVESVTNSLQQIKNDLSKKVPDATGDEERQQTEREVLFIDTLLEKTESGHTKIGVMQNPDRAGLLSEMPLIQNEKTTILKIINENLRYIRKEDNDFRFTISDTSKEKISNFVNLLNNQLVSQFNTISADLRSFLLGKEKLSSNSLDESVNSTSVIDHQLLQITSIEPKTFTKQLTEVINHLGINLPIGHLKKFVTIIEFLDFLQLFSSNNLTIPVEIQNQIEDQKAYINNSQSWYKTMHQLHRILSYNLVQIQVNNFDGSKIMGTSINGENTELLVSDLDLESTFKPINNSYVYDLIRDYKINAFKLKLLQGVWNQTMQPFSHECSSDGKQLVIKGYNVLVSDIMKLDCWSSATHIEIFALNIIFLDANIDKPSGYLSIIAPEWEIGSTLDIKITLNGANGVNYTTPAQQGIKFPDRSDRPEGTTPREKLVYPEKGENGAPGIPGEAGGKFFGIGRLINTDFATLDIYAFGGNGGDGQDGGKGIYKPPLIFDSM